MTNAGFVSALHRGRPVTVRLVDEAGEVRGEKTLTAVNHLQYGEPLVCEFTFERVEGETRLVWCVEWETDVGDTGVLVDFDSEGEAGLYVGGGADTTIKQQVTLSGGRDGE